MMSAPNSPPALMEDKEGRPQRASTDTNVESVRQQDPYREPDSSAGTLKDSEKEETTVPEPTGATEKDDYVYLAGVPLAIVLFAVTFVAFLMLLDTSIIVTAIPRITSDFHSLNDVGCCSFQPTAGKLYTHYSSKWLFLSFLGLFELGSLICGVAQSSKMLIIGRAIAGLGTSGLMNGAFTIVNACVPMHRVPFYLGVLTGLAQLGILLGPLVGGALTQYTTWRWCFYINLPIGGLVSLLLLRIQIPDRKVASTTKLTFGGLVTQLDLVGFLLFAPAAIQALLALQWGGIEHRWSSATIVGLFCGSAGTLAVFLFWEYRMGEGAMLPFSVLRRRIVWSSALLMFFFFGNLYMTTFYLPIYFQAVRNATPTLSGVYILPSILSTIISAISSGIGVGKIGYYLPFSVASGVLMAVGTGLLATFTPHISIGKWIGYQILSGAGRGMGIQMPMVAVQNALPKRQIAIGTSTIIFAQNFGGAVVLSLGQTAFNAGLRSGLVKYAPGVDAAAVIHAGATDVEGIVSGANYAGVIEAYNFAIRNCFYLGTGCGVAVFAFAWGVGWKNVKKEKAIVPEAQAEEARTQPTTAEKTQTEKTQEDS